MLSSLGNTIHLLDAVCHAETGDPICKPLERHSNHVNYVAFSPDGSCIMSGSWDKTIHLWDAETSDPIGKWLKGPFSTVTPSHFCPMDLISCLAHVTTPFISGDAICRPLEGHSSYVVSVAFSPDGSRLAHWKTLFRL
jgi:WD40 repeat protein